MSSSAAQIWRPLADQGDAGAQYLGEGVPQSHAEAVKWFRKAADQGDVLAQSRLAVAYWKGEGVPQSYVSAHMWFNLSAAGGGQDAVKNRDNVARRMTPAQIAEAQKRASEWKPTKPPR